MNPILAWIITGVLVGGVVIAYVLNPNILAGTATAQVLADSLASIGYTVSVESPIGAPKIFAAPEIDAASGASAIALLAGGLLLLGEKFRSRRS